MEAFAWSAKLCRYPPPPHGQDWQSWSSNVWVVPWTLGPSYSRSNPPLCRCLCYPTIVIGGARYWVFSVWARISKFHRHHWSPYFHFYPLFGPWLSHLYWKWMQQHHPHLSSLRSGVTSAATFRMLSKPLIFSVSSTHVDWLLRMVDLMDCFAYFGLIGRSALSEDLHAQWLHGLS